MSSLKFYSGLFLVASAVLMLQIIEVRILSVITWYYLSFFVISVAMFGLTAGAVWVYLERHRFTENSLPSDLTYFSSAFAMATALSLVIQLMLPVHALDLSNPLATTVAMVSWGILLLGIALPFALSGVVVSLALTRSPFPIGLVYGVDLAGAATGCLGVLVLLNHSDGPSAILWVSVLIAAGAFLFSQSKTGGMAPAKGLLAIVCSRPVVVLVVLASFASFNSLTHTVRPIFVKGRNEMALANPPVFLEWNSFSRVAVFELPLENPLLWGPSPEFRTDEWFIEQRHLNIDGDAATRSYRIEGDIGRADFLKYDVTNLAYFLPNRESAAVIGVGGGRDMLAARVFGVPDVTGVEINPIIMRLVTREPGFAEFSGLNGLDGMHFEVDEARSWFARSKRSFDIIQMSLVDTWAATGAGAYTLSENGLYTVEAWRIFLQHLTPRGVFTVSRWYAPGEVNETGRMISLAIAAAMDIGATTPRRHIYVASSGRIASLILSRSPLSKDDVQTLDTVSRDMGYKVLINPFKEPSSPILQQILASTSRAELELFTSGLSLDLTPPTDERPFFFNQLPLRNLGTLVALALSGRAEGVVTGNVKATYTLILLIALSALFVIGTIVVPLKPAIKDVGKKLTFGGSAYFFLIGVGFMSVEIALLQRMSVFLGHPIYSLSIVLFSMILATGIGSIISDKFPLRGLETLSLWSVVAGGYLLTLTAWLPPLLLQLDSSTILWRAAVAIAVIAPAGLLLGYGFPTGMRVISAVDRKPTPWFWGINGAAGVLASSLALLCSMAFGISVTLVVAALCYWLLVPAAWLAGFRDTGTALYPASTSASP